MNAGLDQLPTACHYPAPPPPVDVVLATCQEHPCPYLAGRVARTRALYSDAIPADVYHAFMDSGFRRCGKIIYQPICRGCRECRQLRLAVGVFQPSRSQRRCRRRNNDLMVRIGRPEVDAERLELYQRYQEQWHGGPRPEREELERFLLDSPVETIEMTYRDRAGKLLAVGICDPCNHAFSSVYCYFEPAEARRGLGTFTILREIELASELGIPWYYLGFWVERCSAMAYKADFRPAQILDLDGIWRNLTGSASDSPGATVEHSAELLKPNGRMTDKYRGERPHARAVDLSQLALPKDPGRAG